jgi:hypothetical protein
MKKMSPIEDVFFNHMKRRGYSLKYEPRKFDLGIPRPIAKGNKTYTPDFICFDNSTYYEVVNSYSYYKTTKWKYVLFRKEWPLIKFEIVWPDGDKLEEL